MSVSLAQASQEMGRSSRTLRRWCERGLVPWAYQTKGGHWRLARWSDLIARRIELACKSFSRARTEAAKNAKKNSSPESYKMLYEFTRLNDLTHRGATQRIRREARRQLNDLWLNKSYKPIRKFLSALREASDEREAVTGLLKSAPDEVISDIVTEKITEKELDDFHKGPAFDGLCKAVAEKREQVKLAPVAQRMADQGGRLNQRSLAEQMKISRTTLLKRYGARSVNNALGIAAHYAADSSMLKAQNEAAQRRQSRPRKTKHQDNV